MYIRSGTDGDYMCHKVRGLSISSTAISQSVLETRQDDITSEPKPSFSALFTNRVTVKELGLWTLPLYGATRGSYQNIAEFIKTQTKAIAGGKSRFLKPIGKRALCVNKKIIAVRYMISFYRDY